MSDIQSAWQQELDDIQHEITLLSQRRDARWTELCALQQAPVQSPATVADISVTTTEITTTDPFRANFLLCKLDEDDQRRLRLELERDNLKFCLTALALHQRGADWPAVAAALAVSEVELQRRLDSAGR